MLTGTIYQKISDRVDNARLRSLGASFSHETCRFKLESCDLDSMNSKSLLREDALSSRHYKSLLTSRLTFYPLSRIFCSVQHLSRIPFLSRASRFCLHRSPAADL